ncbi:MAG: DNA polymerase III subunit alpha [Pseudomonadales bacterium]|nr:DNA polymerase III subunit alpha [Gammaproteobacteria bacterium]MBK9667296.1 DNA polymerase III subunit alpha [Gammaproteobacteria bacterium]MBP6051137.1 DNA polymerase III subunit alpha [Pseudomonadales bacterium]MBP6226890.1 DNA polymerase III subunit alpha [Pseudomonadales bacterium]
MSRHFVHLRLHSEFSMIDGLVRIDKLVERAAELGMPAVALTDQSNLYALIKFYKAAQKAGVKPIVGCDVQVETGGAIFPLTLLVCAQEGYRNLTRLISRGWLEGQQMGRPVLQRDWLVQSCDGLIALSGARDGDVGQALLAERGELAQELLGAWMTQFPGRFYIELCRTGRPHEEDYLHLAVELAGRLRCPVVATNDVRFLDRSDYEAHEARVCIHEGRALEDPRRQRLFSPYQYLRPAQEMQALFADIPEALENSVEIARRCSIELELGKYYLPDYPVPAGTRIEDFLQRLAQEGLVARLAAFGDGAARRDAYQERLDFELDTINSMGFAGYFLIVMDFIRWAKNNGVPVGPGRGSGAGSLVAYVLGITDIDPLQYNLLFERFLNPERVSLPDFDVDFCMEGRDRVIAYVADTYGRDAVSQIITFGTMAAKAVVRDVARVQGKPYGLADKLSKLIPFEPGMTLEKAMAQEEPLRDFVARNEEVAEIMEMAFKLEGLARNVGKHAGGVVIAPTTLTDFAPLYSDEAGGGLVTQFDKDDVEQVGLVKFDFLGLRTLTIIDWALAIVNRRLAGEQREPIDINRIALDDPLVYASLQRAETTAIFQLESRGMKDLIKRQQPSCFEDIIALVALFRPGPLQSGMVDDFIDRKHGRSIVRYPHPRLEPILNNTYGVILYQEQVMQIAQVLAGYTLGGADVLRRAMGKKKAEEMAQQREIFIAGASTQGVAVEVAASIFDLMEKFAGYGFNKSHSAAYALVSYQTAWLKTHFPAEFMAAVLSAEMSNTDKVVVLIEECRHMKLALVLPDVNSGEFRFTVNKRGEVVYGLGAIKGIGEGPVESIVAARTADGEFRDLFDFCTRTDPRRVNKRVLEALIRSGAMDGLGASRAVLMAAMAEALKAAEQRARNLDVGLMDMFADNAPASTGEDVYAAFRAAAEWSARERLRGEKETLGLYVTGHPIDDHEAEIAQFARTRIAQLRADQEPQRIVGLVVGMRTMKSKRGEDIAFLQLDDRSARVEVSLFSDVYRACREHAVRDTILVVEGVVSVDDFSGGMRMRANEAYTLVEARRRFARELVLQLGEDDFAADFTSVLGRLLGGGRAREGCAVRVVYSTADASAEISLGDQWRLLPSDEALARLRERLGAGRVSLRYSS